MGAFAMLEFARARRQAERARTKAFAGACKRAGFAAKIPDNIQREGGEVRHAGAAVGLTALTRGPIGPVRANAQSRALLEAAVKETVAVGMALKTGLTPADEGAVMNLIDGFPEGLMASMAHDLLAGKPIEIEGLSGAVARLGEKAGVPARRTSYRPCVAPFRTEPAGLLARPQDPLPSVIGLEVAFPFGRRCPKAD